MINKTYHIANNSTSKLLPPLEEGITYIYGKDIVRTKLPINILKGVCDVCVTPIHRVIKNSI